ncbi:MAG: diguanylate cyclase [Bacillota bacterium]|nr:diguanylate cyclase [Bacillota bacterium]
MIKLTQFDINRKQKIYELISVLKLISLLICGMVLFTQYPEESYNEIWMTNETNNIYTMNYIGIIILVFICEGWLYTNKKNISNQVFNLNGFIETIVFILLYTGLIFISGFHESQYKFLFLFIIIANTIQYGFKVGINTAIINSLIILTIDLLGVKTSNINKYFEVDLVLSGVFIMVAWLLGYYVKLENQYRDKAMLLANLDELTGVYNHRYFQNTLSQHIEEAKKKNTNICLLFIDIDHFKYYNDLYGHSAGDVVLSRFGEIFKQTVREQDIVARYGGEEFAVIIPDICEEEAVKIGNRIRDVIENTYFEGEENQPNGKLTISVGVSCYPQKAKSKQELINTADDALYRAKFFNKNRVESYYSVLEELKSDIDEKHIDLISSIKTLISVINAKDRYTYAHTDRVVIYCEFMAKHLGLSENDRKILRYGAYLHDIGKIQISKDILVKRTKLTDEEWEILKSHPANGVEVIKPVATLKEVWPLILHHHEKFDGTGYPKGIKGNGIPYLARILSVADSFDAMTSNRPYSKRKTYEEAILELEKYSNKQFDPIIVKEFIIMIELNKEILDI